MRPEELMAEPTPLVRVPASAEPRKMLDALHRDGGVIVEGMFPEATIAEMRSDADEWAERFEAGAATQGMGERGAAFVGADTIRFSSLGKMSPAFFDMLDNDVFATLANAELLGTCGTYWLNTAQVMYIGPGQTAQELHRDADNWWELISRTWPGLPEVTLSMMIGLDDVTEELGATRVVPGTHTEGPLSASADLVSVPAELGPGDALVYSGYVLHGGGANVTDRWRKAMHLSVVAGWLTPEEAHPLDYSVDDLAQCSERVKQLLGHRSYLPGARRGAGLWLRHVKEIED